MSRANIVSRGETVKNIQKSLITSLIALHHAEETIMEIANIGDHIEVVTPIRFSENIGYYKVQMWPLSCPSYCKI